MGNVFKLTMDSLPAILVIFLIIQGTAAEAQDSSFNPGREKLSPDYILRHFPFSVDPYSAYSESINEDCVVELHLYSRGVEGSLGKSAPYRPKLLPLDPSKMAEEIVKFNLSIPTMIIIHGFSEPTDAHSVKGTLSALSRTGRWNVVVVNWRKLSTTPWYPWALITAKAAGRYLAHFIDSMASAIGGNSSYDVSKRSTKSRFLEDLHIVGFSLGAHVAGIAGHYTTAGKVGRITGLDPAYPMIELLGPEAHRLDKSDAGFVDVIHTCGGIYGTPFPIGHADFFPNGGTAVQPGCGSLQFPTVCSHWRAWRFFAESLENERSFKSLPCDSWKKFNSGECDYYKNGTYQWPEYMGLGTRKTARGNYYLRTYDSGPFSMALKGNKINPVSMRRAGKKE